MAEDSVKKRRPRRRRWILIVLGLLLGVATTWFFRTIYNPFGRTVTSPLVLIPDDMDFVLVLPDFPKFISELPNQDFVETLDQHAGFQELLLTPFARRTGIVETLRDSFRELNKVSASLPFGLQLLGDVSGESVVVAGYLPSDLRKRPRQDGPEPAVSPDDLRFMAAIQPKSWMAVAAANVLLDPTLTRWFLRDQLSARGVEIEHFRDSVRVKPRGGRDLYFTRIADTVLVGTEGDQLNRIYKEVALEGLPTVAPARYTHLAGGGQTSSPEAMLLARRTTVDTFLDLDGTLSALWGGQTLNLAESCIPRIGGEDLILRSEIGRALSLRLRTDRGLDQPHDLASRLTPFSSLRLKDRVEALARFVPDLAFGLVYAEAPPGQLLDWVFARPEILGANEVKEIDAWCAEHPAFRGRAGLTQKLDDLLEPSLSCIFFRQPREAYPDKAAPGLALVFPVKDEAGLRSMLDSLRAEVVRSAGRGVLKNFVARKEGAVEIFDLELAAGVADDARVTRPGLALVSGHLVITNFLPFAEQMGEVLDRKLPSLDRHAGITSAVGLAPKMMMAAGLWDGPALQPYLEQSAEGWATRRTLVQTSDWVRFRQIFAAEIAPKRGLRPGTREYAEAEELYVDERGNQMQTGRREDVLRDIRSHIRYVDGLLKGFAFFLENTRQAASFDLRLELTPPPKSP